LVVGLLLWEALVHLLNVPAYVLPPPSAVAVELIGQVRSEYLYSNIAVTAVEIVFGYLIGMVMAGTVAIACSQSRVVEHTVMPFVVALETIPKIALAPLVVIWFGYGQESKVVIAALVCFFPILLNSLEGLRNVDPGQLELMKAMNATQWQTFTKVTFPGALPMIFTGLDLGAIFAVIGAIVGEFVGATAGLGYQLLQANHAFDIAGLFATLVWLSLLGVTAHGIILLLRRWLVYWEPSSRRILVT
jgi:NitT/TauT family transport system permease protein